LEQRPVAFLLERELLSMSDLVLLAPLSGRMIPIEEVPDPVFATRMVGDGVSIDPVSACLIAPCDGTVTQLHSAGHALTLTHASGVEVMMHIGLDTVALKGKGFRPLVKAGQAVKAGHRLIEFDADQVASSARSLLTQVVVTNGERVAAMTAGSGTVRAGEDPVLTLAVKQVDHPGAASEHAASEGELSDEVEVPNPLGLHARPAAVLAGLARQWKSDVELVRGGERANAKSVTAIMTMEVKRGDRIRFRSRGPDAGPAILALLDAVRGGLGEEAKAAPSAAPAEAVEPPPGGESDPSELHGIPASPGLAVGAVFPLQRRVLEVAEKGADPATERRALDRAMEQARGELEALETRLAEEADAKRAAIFAAHREILDDPDLSAAAARLLVQGKSAGFAWREACGVQAERLAGLGNELLRERANDVRDVRDRVIRLIVGEAASAPDIPSGSILIAEELTPSDTASLDRTRVLGFATRLGGPTSHVAILARSLDIPAVVAIDPRVSRIPSGTMVVLDGTKGLLRVDPPPAEVAAIRTRLAEQAKRRRELLSHAAEPAITRDGRAIEVAANVGKPEDAASAVAMGAEGCGLLRSEFLFMDRATAPDEVEQGRAYAAVARAFGPERRVVVRTLDVGGDKPLSYLPIAHEENPFLGERGLRVSLLRPELLRIQFRAILRAASLARLHVMLPMVTTVDEFRQARRIFDEERAAANAPAVPLGVMIEVPAAALSAEALAREADFFSIGTNDLTQYTLAIDRGHPRLAAQADALHPAVLRLIRMTCDAAHAHGRWVGVCGGLAGDVGAVPILIGLGVDELSAPGPAVPAVKAAVREVDASAARALAERALECESAAAVRGLLEG
jgi:phosphocarrier protein FPr